MQNRPRWEREDRDSRIDRNRQSKRLVFRRSLFLMLVCGVGLFIPLVISCGRSPSGTTIFTSSEPRISS